MKGEFFALGIPQFERACELGMNPAIALLVMARGTMRDNRTTNWSAYSVHKRTGIARSRAQDAIGQLAKHGLVEVLRKKPRPKYKLQKPSEHEQLIWLPNSLIEGAGEEIPPVRKLREFGDITLLGKFICLYHEQDLEGDGGIPRTTARVEFFRTRIGEIGPLTLYGFRKQTPTATACGMFAEYREHTDNEGNQGAWAVLTPLIELGLLDEVYYMTESSDQESELIYPVTNATEGAINKLWGWMRGRGLHGYTKHYEAHDFFGIAPKHIRNAWMIGCYRLRYRPHTSKTSRWWAQESEKAEAMVGLINHTCFDVPEPICAHQG